jgi:GDP-mannose 6-dehydrogenase
VKISVFGLGYVGAVTTGCLTEQGHHVTGVDVFEKKVDAFKSGESPIVEPGLNDLLSAAKANNLLDATLSAEEAVGQSDVSIVCVGTPSLENGRLNLSYVGQVSAQIAEGVRNKEGHHALIFRSTMLPGSTRAMVADHFQDLVDAGRLTVLYCPEFLREGTAVKDFRDPSLSVIGTADGTSSNLMEVQNLLGDNPQLLAWEGAELIKYSCNYFHALKVGFANEIGRIGKEIGIDSSRVMDVVCNDTRLNISSYYMKPGNPFGGSCLPKDVSALAAFSRQAGLNLPVLDSVLPTNQAHLDALLRDVYSKGKQPIAILGLAFKQDTDDLRGSPMVAVAESLLGRGYEVRIYDPDLNLAELIGANERMISRTMPHLSSLLKPSAQEAVAGAGIVIAAQKCTTVDELALSVNGNQCVIDVNGWRELAELEWQYEGSCW